MLVPKNNEVTRRELTITLEGLPEEKGNVRLNEFVFVLDKIRSALVHANYHLTGQRRGVFHVSHLSHNSPATASIQNREETPELFSVFGTALASVGDGSAAKLIGYPALEDILDVTKRVLQRRIDKIFVNGIASTDFDADFAARIQKELTPTETCYGTVEGILEALNLHAGANRFTIFPVSVERGITCYIPESLHDTAIRAVRHKVAVTGKLKFRPRDMLPSEVDVEDMTTFPPDSELPTFADLRGMAPQMTGDKSTEEYLAEIRDAWN